MRLPISPRLKRLRRGIILVVFSATLFLARHNPITLSAHIIQQTSTLSVDAASDLGPISPFVYGVNYGPWSPLGLDIMPQALTLPITFFRYPAGEWGDDNDLSDFQIDLYIALVRKFHAEPSISVRLKGGTPEKAAKLVHYANIEKQYKVHYWSIGNEPNLYRNYSVDQFNKDWRTFAQAMLAVDPTIALIGPEINQYPPSSDVDFTKLTSWFRSFLKANGDLVSVVSVHRYPFPKVVNGPTTTLQQLMDSAREWDEIIPSIRRDIQETVGHALPIAITEINSDWSHSTGGAASPDTFANAIWWTDVLGHLIRQRVDIVAYFTLHTTSDFGTVGLLNRYEVRPTFYVYQLYKQFGSELLQTDSTDTDVTITAAKRSDGALTFMVVNRSNAPKSVTLSISGFSPSGPAELWRLDPDHKAEKIGTIDLATGKLDLPAQSASLYIVPSMSTSSQAATQPGG